MPWKGRSEVMQVMQQQEGEPCTGCGKQDECRALLVPLRAVAPSERQEKNGKDDEEKQQSFHGVTPREMRNKPGAVFRKRFRSAAPRERSGGMFPSA